MPRHRCDFPREGLAKLGVESGFAQVGDGDLQRRSEGCSHVVLNRVPFTPEVARAAAAIEAGGAKVLWDMDDLLFDPTLLGELPFVRSRAPADRERLLRASAQMREGMVACGVGLCATTRLAREAEGLSRAFVVENCVCDELVALSLEAVASRAATDHLTIGFPSGHPGHVFNFALLKPALRVLFARHSRLRLRVIGWSAAHARGLEAFVDRIDAVPYLDWRAVPRELAKHDVSVAPLVDDRFCACKSDLKYLEAALCGVPLVASRVAQFSDTIRDGENGLLASSDDEWVDKLELLLADPDRRSALANAAHQDVLSHRRSEVMGMAVLRALAQSRAS
jgi:glycosyltransferase involved in cell wall biosynthesis